MSRVDTAVEDSSLFESPFIKKGIFIGFLLAQAATGATASYSPTYSSTAVQDLSFAVQDFLQRHPFQRPTWLNDCGMTPSVADTKSIIQEQIFAVIETRHEYQALPISDLRWSIEETIETRGRLISFEEDWDAPDMELYDDL